MDSGKRPGQVAAVLGAALLVAAYLSGLYEPLSNYDEPIYAEFVRASMAPLANSFTSIS